MKPRLLLLLVALAACPSEADALSTDREQPVRIEADSAAYDDRKRIATYNGSVVIVQGSLRITGELVTMHFDADYGLVRLIAEGEPAHFEQRRDDGPVQEGKAARIEYQVEDGAMLFAGRAQITQGEFRMGAEHIDYDSVTGNIRGMGDGNEEEKQRVRINLRLGSQ